MNEHQQRSKSKGAKLKAVSHLDRKQKAKEQKPIRTRAGSRQFPVLASLLCCQHEF